ncbi:MAG TPA: hypothetical protein VIX18_03760, partial [Nitrospirota bacterium]
LWVKDIKETSKIVPLPDGRTEYFAAWLHLGDIWKTSGDFSMPKSDPAKYRTLERDLRAINARLEALDTRLKAREAKGENVKKLRRQWKEARAAAAHEPSSVSLKEMNW